MSLVNMKPDPGEQADALWAQKLADNTGFLLKRPIPQIMLDEQSGTEVRPSAAGGDQIGSVATCYSGYLFRPAGHNTAVFNAFSAIDFVFGNTPDNYGTIRWGIYGDLGTYLDTTTFTQNNTSNYSFQHPIATTLPLGSYVSENAFAVVQCISQGSSRDFSPGVNPGTFNYRFGTIRAYTYWA